MRGVTISLAALMFLPPCGFAQDVANRLDCARDLLDAAPLLDADWMTFDQTPNGGYRPMIWQGCHIEVAVLLDAFIERHPREFKEHSILAFHAGQAHAQAGDYPKAIEYFELTHQADEPEDSPGHWNDYVDATLAFLRNDGATLERIYVKVAADPDVFPTSLDNIENLLDHIGQPYRVARENFTFDQNAVMAYMLRRDANGDGNISLSEEVPERLLGYFVGLDTNKDGVIDADEREAFDELQRSWLPEDRQVPKDSSATE